MKTKQTLRGLIAATLAGIAFGAAAQSAQPPTGLKWQMMHEIVFNSTNFSSTGTEEERVLLGKIWEKELQGSEKNIKTGELLPSFSLIGTVEYKGVKAILTMYNRSGSDCIEPGNGKGMYDMYAICPLRLIRLTQDKQAEIQNLPVNFCMLSGDDHDNPRSKNHNEYTFDERSGIVYLRTIQYGKVVSSCNRALRVFKV